jgi:hypothetical protein
MQTRRCAPERRRTGEGLGHGVGLHLDGDAEAREGLEHRLQPRDLVAPPCVRRRLTCDQSSSADRPLFAAHPLEGRVVMHDHLAVAAGVNVESRHGRSRARRHGRRRAACSPRPRARRRDGRWRAVGCGRGRRVGRRAWVHNPHPARLSSTFSGGRGGSVPARSSGSTPARVGCGSRAPDCQTPRSVISASKCTKSAGRPGPSAPRSRAPISPAGIRVAIASARAGSQPRRTRCAIDCGRLISARPACRRQASTGRPPARSAARQG